jgi:hypothetical protein
MKMLSVIYDVIMTMPETVRAELEDNSVSIKNTDDAATAALSLIPIGSAGDLASMEKALTISQKNPAERVDVSICWVL